MSMSVQAWRLPGKNFHTTLAFLRETRKGAVAVSTDFFHDWMARKVATHLDQLALLRAGLPTGGRKLDTSISALQSAHNEIIQLRRNPASHNDHELRFGASVVLHEGPRGSTLLQLYAANPAIREYLSAQFDQIGIDYSYWNNSDRPDELTARQWKARGEVWNRLFEDSPIPSEVGLQHFLLSDHFIPPAPALAEITARLPGFEDRVKSWTKEIGMEKICQQLQKTDPNGSMMTHVMRAASLVNKSWEDEALVSSAVRCALWPVLPEQAMDEEDLTAFHAAFEQQRLESGLDGCREQGPRFRL
jgi:hypothetical protein